MPSLRLEAPIMDNITIDKLMEAYYRPMVEVFTLEVPPLLSMMGYTKNPLSCHHDHKRFKTKWVCVDCGADL